MIRLKFLLEANDIDTKNKTINVLFVGDNELYDTWAFNKKLTKSEIIVAENKVFKTSENLNYLVETLQFHVNDTYNLVVVFSNGHQEKNSYTAIEQLDTATNLVHGLGIPIVLNTFPTLQYSKLDKSKLQSKQEILDNVNNWLRTQSSADFILDVEESLNSEVYFTKDGLHINAQGHSKLAKIILKYILQNFEIDKRNIEKFIDDDTDNKNESDVDIKTIQLQLQQLGYKINPTEITNQEIGNTTKLALKQFQKKYNLRVTGTITIETVIKIKLLLNLNNDDTTDNFVVDFDTEVPIYRKNMPRNVKEFIDTWKDTAIKQRELHGIPASITLAQAALESGWGTSYLSQVGRNFFGVRCGSWNGNKIYAKDELGPKSCYRAYESVEDSFEDHSKVLMQSRYHKAFTYPVTDYENWAIEIEKGGYATKIPGKYSGALIKLIKSYGLDDYDKDGESKDGESKDGESKSLWTKAFDYISTLGTAAAGGFYGLATGKVNSGKVVTGGINGDWAGSMSRTLQIAKLANDFVGKNIITSQKRTKVKTASGNTSDHYIGQTNAYAVDLATRGAAGDELFYHIMNFLGKTNLKPGKWHNINKDGYRYQVGWQVPDHYDHIHVGVKKL